MSTRWTDSSSFPGVVAYSAVTGETSRNLVNRGLAVRANPERLSTSLLSPSMQSAHNQLPFSVQTRPTCEGMLMALSARRRAIPRGVHVHLMHE